MKTAKIIHDYLQYLNIKEVKSLEDIAKLMQAHEKAFAFSSLKVLLQEPISLELEDIYTSLVLKKRGGYCFEHNKLLYETLHFLGFNVEFYLARVINNSNIEVPKTHRFTLLKLENKRYIVDVGIGFRSPCVPICLEDETTLSHLNIFYRITIHKDRYYLERLEKKGWFKVTQFDLHPCTQADFELSHFYSHQHPKATFVNNLVVSKVTPEIIYSLRNNQWVIFDKMGVKETVIENKAQFMDIIENIFELNYTDEELTILYTNYCHSSFLEK